MRAIPAVALPRRVLSRWKAWIAVARLPFYLLSGSIFTAAALAGARHGGWSLGAFAAGLAVLVIIEFITVLTNELEDEASDRANRAAGPFNGGSRVLVNGQLSRDDLRRARSGALVLLGVIVAGWILSAPSWAWSGGLLAVAGLVLGIGYSAPPLRLSFRTLGEFTVALVHGFLATAAGWWTQTGSFDLTILTAGAPLVLAVLPSIILSGFPDAAADAVAGKRTLVVRTGPRGAAITTIGATLLAPFSLVLLAGDAGVPWWLAAGAAGHALVLAGWTVWTVWHRHCRQPMHSLIGTSLAFVLWFVIALALA